MFSWHKINFVLEKKIYINEGFQNICYTNEDFKIKRRGDFEYSNRCSVIFVIPVTFSSVASFLVNPFFVGRTISIRISSDSMNYSQQRKVCCGVVFIII